MTYQEFKEQLVSRLEEFCGADVEITVDRVQRNNGVEFEGIYITEKGKPVQVAPIVPLECLYGRFEAGEETMEDCIGKILDSRKETEDTAIQLYTKFVDWEFVNDHVYPVLCNTVENEEMLKGLPHGTLLDLSIYYEVRLLSESGRIVVVKVTYALLERYGITEEALQEKAYANMKRDGYEVKTLCSMIQELTGGCECCEDNGSCGLMHNGEAARDSGGCGLMHNGEAEKDSGGWIECDVDESTEADIDGNGSDSESESHTNIATGEQTQNRMDDIESTIQQGEWNEASEPSQTTDASEGKSDVSAGCELIPGVAYIVTNHVRLHGASALIDSDFLQEFAGGRNLYILPSSIHDLIIVQETADMNPAMLDAMVQQVNSESVGKEEQLADHAYFYDVSDAELRIRA